MLVPFGRSRCGSKRMLASLEHTLARVIFVIALEFQFDREHHATWRDHARLVARLSIVIASAAKRSIGTSRIERRMPRCTRHYVANAAAHSHTRASQSDLRDTIATLSADRKRIHATRRRTAVEIATCRRQCAVALRSNFCRHTNRMVNRQANVLTCADVACRRLIGGAFAPASTTMRHHAGAIGSLSSPQGVCKSVQL
jgi:hypothetical protein